MTQYRRNYQRRQPGGSAGPRPADIYQQVTDRIVASLEAGTVPWRKPWRTAGGMPRSMSTGRRYQGVNVMLLAMTAWDRGYTSSWWSTLSRSTSRAVGSARGRAARTATAPPMSRCGASTSAPKPTRLTRTLRTTRTPARAASGRRPYGPGFQRRPVPGREDTRSHAHSLMMWCLVQVRTLTAV